jgi:CHAT domain-containing protein
VRALPRDGPIFFVPDKALHGVPFAALRLSRGDPFLIEEHAISVLPAARLVPTLLSRRQPPAATPNAGASLFGAPAFDPTAFANLPPLPGAAREVREIAQLYPGATVHVAAEATRANLLAELDRHPVFHFAGHAVANPRRPGLSHLVLAADPADADAGLLYAHEIARLRFDRLRLAVLSACSTISPQESRIAGLSGLARPFLDAGAAAVVGTLWPIEDQPAHSLLRDFHRRFRATGDAAESLRGAQVAKLTSGAQPTEWAGFQLVGTLGSTID